MADPWEGCNQGWGPGPLEDYVKLTQQGKEPTDLLEAFDIFIKRNVDTTRHAHLLDYDDNDGEFIRRLIRKYTNHPDYDPEYDG